MDDGYRPLGHLSVGDPGADCVQEIRVDGVKIDGIDEFNDVEGWAAGPSPRAVGQPFPEGVRYYEYADNELRVKYVGKVRVTLGESRWSKRSNA